MFQSRKINEISENYFEDISLVRSAFHENNEVLCSKKRNNEHNTE